MRRCRRSKHYCVCFYWNCMGLTLSVCMCVCERVERKHRECFQFLLTFYYWSHTWLHYALYMCTVLDNLVGIRNLEVLMAIWYRYDTRHDQLTFLRMHPSTICQSTGTNPHNTRMRHNKAFTQNHTPYTSLTLGFYMWLIPNSVTCFKFKWPLFSFALPDFFSVCVHVFMSAWVYIWWMTGSVGDHVVI